MEKNIKDVCNIPDVILEQLQKDIAEIKVALLGNAYNPTGGLLCRTTEVEKQMDILKRDLERMSRKYDKIIWTAVGVGTGMSLLVTVLSVLVGKIF